MGGVRTRRRNRLNQDSSFGTWLLLCAVACTDLLFRIIFIVTVIGGPNCYDIGDLWRYRFQDLYSIHSQFKFIWASLSLLAVIELVRCILFKWRQRKFILTANFLIAASSLWFYVNLNKVEEFFQYEKGLIALEETIFYNPDFFEYYPIHESEVTEEFWSYHQSQCTRRVVYGDFSAEHSLKKNMESFQNLGGEVFTEDAGYWFKQGFGSADPFYVED